MTMLLEGGTNWSLSDTSAPVFYTTHIIYWTSQTSQQEVSFQDETQQILFHILHLEF